MGPAAKSSNAAATPLNVTPAAEEEMELKVWIDRELELNEVFKVKVGSTVKALKGFIAGGDPTGNVDTSDIGLKLVVFGCERLLDDHEPITKAISELDLCSPDEC